MVKTIILTKGKRTQVDDNHFDWLNQFKWRINKGGYVIRNVRIGDKRTIQYMHRLIVGLEIGDNREVDHIDCNKLNNCTGNLRICTHSQNRKNNKIQINNSTGYRGVDYVKRRKKYRARIRQDGKLIDLGYFDTAQEAGIVWETEAKRLRGEFYYDSQRA